MQLTNLLCGALASTMLVNAAPWPPKVPSEFTALGCPATTRPWASQRDQLYAITDFYEKLFGGKPYQAFDQWCAKDFIQHAADAPGNGTAIAEATVAPLLATSHEDILNIFAGPDKHGVDYGHIYFRGINPHGVGAISEYWRFIGTCMVEHWNVFQEVTNSSNPIAHWSS